MRLAPHSNGGRGQICSSSFSFADFSGKSSPSEAVREVNTQASLTILCPGDSCWYLQRRQRFPSIIYSTQTIAKGFQFCWFDWTAISGAYAIVGFKAPRDGNLRQRILTRVRRIGFCKMQDQDFCLKIFASKIICYLAKSCTQDYLANIAKSCARSCIAPDSNFNETHQWWINIWGFKHYFENNLIL
jgi:hypothetical protein